MSTTQMVRTALAAATIAAAAGCGDAPADEVPEGVADATSGIAPDATSGMAPDAAFEALEGHLRAGGPPVRIAFDVTAEGAVTAHLTGTVLLGEGGRARVEATGDFAGQSVDVTLISDGERMFWTGAEAGAEASAPTPSALRDALALGFTRMGILHNLARLVAAAPPDHADGGVGEWVSVTPSDERAMMEGTPAGAATASVFRTMTVSGQRAGAFALEFDGGIPAVRRQQVEFPGGIMQVTERYRVVEFGADIPESAFDTTPLDPSR